MALTVKLEHVRGCLEGVLPAVIATCAADGTPNVTYLSKVTYVDPEHIALSNQFFSKTLENVRQNPHVQITLIHPENGRQLRIDARFERSETEGELFEQVRAELDAIATLMRMQAVFKLRAVDVFRVTGAEYMASDAAPPTP
jgi:predicted pyridoxine 5'-phosphate oxidase superfamily flavin-nucleotide-binding protein